MKKKFLVLCIAISIIATGCSNNNPTDPTPTTTPASTPAPTIKEETKDYSKALEAYTIDAKESASYESDIKEFDLGKFEYTAESGKTMPYNLRGIIGVPKGDGKFPLILITHGSHSNEDESLRFDTGFTYLVEELAQNGYIAVSMDMSRAYIWKYGDSDDKEKSIYLASEHIKSLQAANSGKENKFPINLKDKIDFSNIGLIGHSRGGDTIFDIALNEAKEGVSINGILSVAPVIPNDIETKNWPDSMVSILVPEYDGDVISLDGFAINTILDNKIEKLHTATFLRKANHNYFNTNIKDNDARLARSEEQLSDQLSPDKQQVFLSNFAIDFFNASLNNKTEGTIYTLDSQTPNKMYGLDVMCRIGGKNDLILISGSEKDKLTSTNCEVSSVKDSWFFEDDEIPADTITFGQESYKSKSLLNVQWKQPDSSLAITPENKNFSEYSALSLRIISDPASELNKNIDHQYFSVVLKDSEGNTSSVTLPNNLNSLLKTPGVLDSTPLDDKEIFFWSFPSPILSTSIPLSDFEGVNLENIESVNVNFDKTESGSVYIENILLQ